MMKLLFLFLVASVSQTLVLGQAEKCVEEIENFFKCKEAARGNDADFEATRLLVNQCFTSNNCEDPETARQQREEVRQCLNGIKKNVKDTCEAQVSPGFSFPEPGHRGHGHHHPGHRRGHGGKESRMIADLCPETADKDAVRSCINGVVPDREARHQQHQETRQAFIACDNAVSSTCTTVLDEAVAKMCTCSQEQLSTPERESAIQQCVGLDTSGRNQGRRGPPKLQMFCRHVGRHGGPYRGRGFDGQNDVGRSGGGRRRHGHGQGDWN